MSRLRVAAQFAVIMWRAFLFHLAVTLTFYPVDPTGRTGRNHTFWLQISEEPPEALCMWVQYDEGKPRLESRLVTNQSQIDEAKAGCPMYERAVSPEQILVQFL